MPVRRRRGNVETRPNCHTSLSLGAAGDARPRLCANSAGGRCSWLREFMLRRGAPKRPASLSHDYCFHSCVAFGLIRVLSRYMAYCFDLISSSSASTSVNTLSPADSTLSPCPPLPVRFFKVVICQGQSFLVGDICVFRLRLVSMAHNNLPRTICFKCVKLN